jgi:hypothetical protein
MRSKFSRLFGVAALLLLTLALIDGSDAQPGGPPFPKKGGPFARPLTVDQIVERIMAFDKNKDGKITIDELPERMQHLIALGDLDKNGALDRDEIRKLAVTLEAFTGLSGPGGPGGLNPSPGLPPKGFGKGGPKGGPKGPAGEAQRTLDELNITGETRDKADRVLRATQDKIRRFDELSRAELILQMKDILNEEDYRIFKLAMDNPPGPKGKGKGKGPRPPGPQDLNGRIDQLQKELDELRRKLPK